MLNSLREENAIISNIVSLAPIIFLKANKDTDISNLHTSIILGISSLSSKLGKKL
jgi:hypothetical protein